MRSEPVGFDAVEQNADLQEVIRRIAMLVPGGILEIGPVLKCKD
jgi:hypothetical protein